MPFAQPNDLKAALQGAVVAGDLPRIQMLLDRGAQSPPNLLQSVALAPVQLPPPTLALMIARGADVNVKSSFGLPLIEFARRHGNSALVNALSESGVRAESSPPVPSKSVPRSPRAAVEKSLPLLQRADVAFLDKAGCVSCHNNSLTAMTVAAARAKHLPLNERIAKSQLERIAAFLRENGERAHENLGIPGAIDTVSYLLLGMAADAYPSNPITDIWARYLKNNQSPDGRWKCMTRRPPLEESDFQVTASSIRSLLVYGPKSQRTDFDNAAKRGIQWLQNARPDTTEDHVFKILGLHWARANYQVIRTTAHALLALQRPDGGWAQTKSLASDAYATGQALVSLQMVNATTNNSESYKRGIQFLLKEQREDGSWHVPTRAPSFQPYFDSDFPHGPDQFISAAATNWAAMALITAIR